MEELYLRAYDIAIEAFEGKTDKGGMPYMLHCIYVAQGVKHLGVQAQIVGLLHDLLEDCPEWNRKRLLDNGFDIDTILLIEMLTKEKEDSYTGYLEIVKMSEVTTAIKLVDLEHNMDVRRLKEIKDKDVKRLKKYHNAYKFLTGK